ncbi:MULTISPECIES: hypothetical protein [Lentibacillus]|uniref:G-protein coupled receptors family 1 profile domain-containing protein n=2 Tax=Lentibacillus TaxID=175304 RepID=A0A4Y9ABH1_9BACI|nr:hypothetical protein [Lentibacillus salicampi]TFJ93136.1 hypothetical protein E4U82_08695 [Lentibacillus salicampi]
MTIFIPAIILFVILFLFLSIWIYKGTKKEREETKANLFHVIGTAFILAMAPTVAITLVLLALFGSTNVANTVFSLNISTSQLIFLTISLFLYLYTIDSFICVLVEHIMGNNIFNHIALLLIRILAFYGIGLIFGLSQTSNFLIAIVVACIVFFIEYLQENNKAENKSSR